tara:strand:+ start:37 stop:1737 length:1701 start_codon:yes stop_codon:yes gene_type:complete
MNNKEFENLDKLLNFDNAKKDIILKNLFFTNSDYFINNDYNIDVSSDVYTDTNINKWAQELPDLYGSKLLILEFLNNPINNKDILIKRQSSYMNDTINFEILKEYENDILWIYKLNQEINKDNAINILFPSSYFLYLINYFEPLLDSYHIYKIGFIPFSSIMYPLTSIFAPLCYINKYLKLNMSVYKYLNLMKKFIYMFLKPSGNIRVDILKIIAFFIYVFLYIYNIYQTFEYSYILYKTKKTLHKKMSGVINFINEVKYIFNLISYKDILSPYLKNIFNPSSLNCSNTMTNIYKYWKNNDIKNSIDSLLISIYTIDIINSISKLKNTSQWNYPTYDNNIPTKIWDIKNPLLKKNQISNPINLSKNIIITGPNAAGKTTYVKSILSNIILAQTFGIIYGIKGNIIIYDTIYSFMRISDEIGYKSYFEVEAEYCSKMINKANELSKSNKNGLFLMDEPMHSTPPTEGMATAYAVGEYIGNLPHINIIITTHFHKLILLETNYPDKFINLSVEAIPNKDSFIFPYKIKKGYSYQCIAIELLSCKKFPDSVIKSAIEMKKIIYNNINSN